VLADTRQNALPLFFGRLCRNKPQHWPGRTSPWLWGFIEGLHNLSDNVKRRNPLLTARFPRVDPKSRRPAFLPYPLAELKPLCALKVIFCTRHGCRWY
jgi:hypothetical protein